MGQTPLHFAFNYDNYEDNLGLVKLLVERGADVNTQDKDHLTPLHLASYHRRLESVQLLLDLGANVNAKHDSGQTSLHGAFFISPKYHPADHLVAQLLVKHGAEVNARDEFYETPLHLASRLGLFEGAWVLLKHGADLNAKNNEGKTPFQLVCEIPREARGPDRFIRSMMAERVVLMGLLYES